MKNHTRFHIEGDIPRELTINTTVSFLMIENEYGLFGGKTGCIWGTNEIDGYLM